MVLQPQNVIFFFLIFLEQSVIYLGIKTSGVEFEPDLYSTLPSYLFEIINIFLFMHMLLYLLLEIVLVSKDCSN